MADDVSPLRPDRKRCFGPIFHWLRRRNDRSLIGDRLVSKLDHMFEPKASARRVEVIRGSGRRRQFSADDKARFVEETLASGAVVSEVARPHGLSAQQLFTWHRQTPQPAAIPAAPERQMFLPAVVTPSSTPPEPSPRQRRRVRTALGGVESSGKARDQRRRGSGRPRRRYRDGCGRYPFT